MTPTALADSGAQFDVVVSNIAGVVTSDVAVLTVNPYVPTPPSITQQPQDQSVDESDPASFTVAATGDVPLHYQWHRDGVAVESATGTTFSLALTTELDDGAAFHVVVSNMAGVVTSEVATLTVIPLVFPPVIVTQPQDKLVFEPTGAPFSVSATGDAPLFYQWRRDGVHIDGAILSSYVLSPTRADDDGAEIDVVVSNAVGVATSTVAVLTVVPEVIPPAISLHPSDRTAKEPAGAIFSVRASGDPPLSYTWRVNGAAVSGATAWDFTFSPTALSDNGSQIDAVVTGPGGSVTSQVAILTVTPSHQPPTVTMQPSSRTVIPPMGATFSVRATGDPTLSYQWRRNGASIVGARAWDYAISSTTAYDDGTLIDVIVSNPGGSATSLVAVLTVDSGPLKPKITVQPQDVGVTEAETAPFAVTAIGDEPFFYQWFCDGAAVPAATSSVYHTSATVLADRGSIFDVVISNAVGQVRSRQAILTVYSGDDLDGDGIANEDEAALGTDPLKPDTDGDGLLDGWETTVSGTDPTKADSDGDGLSDFAEVVVHRTDPNDPDSDGDGVNDGDEIAAEGPGLAPCDDLRVFDPSDPGTTPLATRRPSFAWTCQSSAVWFEVEIKRSVRGRWRRYKRLWVNDWQTDGGSNVWNGLAFDLPSGVYNWSVRAYRLAGRRRLYGAFAAPAQAFTVAMTLPTPAPQLASLNGTEGVGIAVTNTDDLGFQWTTSGEATYYEIELQRLRGTRWVKYGRPIRISSDKYAEQAGIVTSRAVMDLPLGSWRWRVRAANADGVSAWSSTPEWGYFDALWPAPSVVPVIVAPVSGAVLSSRTPDLAWERLSNTSRYYVELERHRSGRWRPWKRVSVAEDHCALAGGILTWTPGLDLGVSGEYRWRLTARNSAGSGPVSPWEDFAVQVLAPSQPSIWSPDGRTELRCR